MIVPSTLSYQGMEDDNIVCHCAFSLSEVKHLSGLCTLCGVIKLGLKECTKLSVEQCPSACHYQMGVM